MSKPASLWSRDFLLLWQGSAVSALGSQAYAIGLMLWAKEATQSGTVVGLILFAGGVTGLLMPFGGVLADRYSRTRLLVLLDCASGVCVLALAGLFWLAPGAPPRLVPVVLVLNFARGAAMALFHPVATAFVPELVAEESLHRANASLQTTVRLATLLGQSVAGLLFRTLGAPLLFALDGLSFLLSALSECWIREPPRTPRTTPRAGVLQDLRDGLRYTGRIHGFRLYLLTAAGSNLLLAALFVCLPFHVEDVWHASPDWYGYLLAAMGLGAVLGSSIARWFPRPGVGRGSVQLVSVAIIDAVPLLVSLAGSTWSALGAITLAWTCVGFHQVLLTTQIQKRTPPEIRGRVFGLLTMIRFGLTPIGMVCFGLLMDALGGQTTPVLAGAGLTGLVVMACVALHPDYRAFFLGDESEVPELPVA